ncbi:MAG: hypothetical protein R3E84_22460 [Pseudomonadales bacterium]
MYEAFVQFLKDDLPGLQCWRRLSMRCVPAVDVHRWRRTILLLEPCCPRREQRVFSGAGHRPALVPFTVNVTWAFMSSSRPQSHRPPGILWHRYRRRWPWPVAGQILFAILVVDLLNWFHHFVKHSADWAFHAVHHAQREMNFFTCLRVHPIDYLISH